MSNFTINKQDGSKTTFNFILDNGLPVKPIIAPKYSECYFKEDNSNAIYIYLTEEEIKTLQTIEKVSKNYVGDSEIWFEINEQYIVLGNVSAKIVKEFLNKKINIYFFKEDKTFIKGLSYT